MFWRKKKKEPRIYADDIKALTNKREELDEDIKSLRDTLTFLCPNRDEARWNIKRYGTNYHNPVLANAINDRIKKLQKAKDSLHLSPSGRVLKIGQ